MNFSKLKNMMSEKKLSTKDIAERIGMTYEGLNKAFKEESIKVNTLEKISEVLNVPVTTFFEGEKIGVQVVQNGARDNHVSIGECQEKVKGLEAMVTKQEKEIEFLRELLKSKS